MPSIPIVAGIYTDSGPDARVAHPVNMMPVPKTTGVSDYYLRPHDGVVPFASGAPGVDRGGINWRGVCYRVMGPKLVSVSSAGVITVLADVGDGGYATLDYGFDRLAIASGGILYYWDGTTLTQVIDPDIRTVVDMAWIDGYYMTTDGEFLVVTELNDPTQVNPFKYGSSEANPDPVVALLRLRNEIYALNRHTIEVFDNRGGSLFPFERIEGAQIQKGCVGTHACCVFSETIAFLGSGRNESPAVYIGANATATPVSTQDIDNLLQNYTEEQLALVRLESRVDQSHKLLYVHLPDRTIVYDHAASEVLNQRVWFTLVSTVDDTAQYLANGFVWCYDRWIVGDPVNARIGALDSMISSHWGDKVRWEFVTPIVYSESRGAIFHELELVALTGRVALGDDPRISTSYSTDGMLWSQDKYISAGKLGDRLKRLVWWQQGVMRDWRVQRFRGDSDAHISVLRLEARIEPLAA